jgi:hypothetical protein
MPYSHRRFQWFLLELTTVQDSKRWKWKVVRMVLRMVVLMLVLGMTQQM